MKKKRLRKEVKTIILYIICSIMIALVGLGILKLWSIRDAQVRCSYNSSYCSK